MASPLLRYPDAETTMPLQLAGHAARYATAAAYGRVRIACGSAWNKRDKGIRRLIIADAAGKLQLTVPINHPEHIIGTRLCDLTISSHNEWWRMMVTALESAYGRTPYFEFYIDRFRDLLSERAVGMKLTDFCKGFDEIISDILGLDCEIIYDEECSRRTAEESLPGLRYPQHREAEFGFIDGVSILDLIFCHGPEAPLYLLKYQQSQD